MTLYTVYRDFGFRFGEGWSGDPSTDFDDVVDQYAEAIDDGDDAMVWRIDPPCGDQAGMVVDVTNDANAALCERLKGRGVAA